VLEEPLRENQCSSTSDSRTAAGRKGVVSGILFTGPRDVITFLNSEKRLRKSIELHLALFGFM
jgi:hypothetical protein